MAPSLSHAADTHYSFNDVQAVLNARCVLCHNNQVAAGRLEGGLNLTNYNDIMRAVIPGHPIKSAMFTFANTGYMPEGKRPNLSEKEKDILYFWIYNGASHSRLQQESWQWINQHIIVTQCASCHRENSGLLALDNNSNDNYLRLQPFLDNAFKQIVNKQQLQHPAVDLSVNQIELINNWLNTGGENDQIPQANWRWINTNIIQKQCRVCHNDQLVELSTYEDVMKIVVPGNAVDSPLFGVIESGFMPQDIPLLQNEVDVIYEWIMAGAKEN